MLFPAEVHAVRAARQRLTTSRWGETDEDYLETVRALGPIRPPSYAYPGTPVLLHDRHRDGDGAGPLEVGERVRRRGGVVKGRFQHGHIAYVPGDEVGLHLAAFARPLEPDGEARRLVETLEREGPLQRGDLAEISGVERRRVGPALEKLQKAGLVFEDQTETAWDNPWGLIEVERPAWVSSQGERREARLEVLGRFTRAHAFTSVQEARDWSGWPLAEVRALLEALVAGGELVRAAVEGWGEHFLASDFEPVALEPCVAVLDPGDPLVTAQLTDLKADFPDVPVLNYVLLDGEIVGVVEGRWGIKAFDALDVRVPERARSGPLRLEVIEKVRRHFPPPDQRVRRYAGEWLDGPREE